ncbi:MAG: efflux RND transporter permease subunit [Alphaproteobacteria bacterium]|nr:efflux RND transporter permease subunit [Alphaproteobacteria bacterium]
MSFSEIFIRRPVATCLLAVGLFLVGAVAFVLLPVAPLPHVDYPTINVSAKLPGADPVTMAATVAAPLERRLGEIAGVDELTSVSSQGAAGISVQFDLDRNIDGAARDVMAAINASGSDLPVDLPTPPTYRKANPADAPILILAVTSDVIPPGKLYDACDSILNQSISQVEGVAQVLVSGADKPAVRVAVNPTALASTGLGMEDVRTALASANVDEPKGGFDGARQAETVAANDQLYVAADYAPLLVKPSTNGTSLRLRDIASVTDGVENDKQAAWFNGGKAIIIIIFKQADANVIETVDRIKRIMPQLEAWMPTGSKISVLSDRTQTIRASVSDVEITLLISIALVVLVVWFSLGRFTPTVAASVTVPLSLSGTFAAMWLLGYSLDNISLMALIVSVGFVVDDAIVMIENITRHVESGERPLEAAVKGAREITFTVMSISISLVAVFIPLLFMGSIIGRLFHEFAVTLTIAIAISMIVSLTVTPTVYGQLMERRHRGGGHAAPTGWAAQAGERLFSWMHSHYRHGLSRVMRRQGMMLGVMLGTILLTVALYKLMPMGFFPQQDTGMIQGTTEARTDVSFRSMVAKQQEVAKVILADPAVAGMGMAIGSGGGNSVANQGRLYITLKPIKERDVSADQVISRLRPKLAKVEGMATFLTAVQDIRTGGRASKAQYQFVLIDESLEELREWVPKYLARMRQEKDFTDVSSDMDAAAQQVNISVDRDAASRLGIDMSSLDAVLEDAFAQRQVSTIYTQRNQYHVVLEVDKRYQENPLSLDKLYVKTAAGQPVPLSAVAHYTIGLAPVSVTHQGQFPASALTFNLPAGSSLSDATKRIQDIGKEINLPPTVHTQFAGNAKVFADLLRGQPILIGAALLAIYIVLGVLYESTVHPVTIISTLPSAGLGALLALKFTGNDLSIIGMIGVILLMGIVKKNGIMMVDFAIVAERDKHKSPQRAIMEACNRRFRPILMTTMAAVLGALPLALGGGTGAELRRPLGIAVVGGLVVSQMMTLYTTPVVYLAMERLRLKMHRMKARHFDTLPEAEAGNGA